MILKLVFKNTIRFCAYFVIFLCFYNCKYLSIDLIIVIYNVAGLGNNVKVKASGNFLGQTNLTLFFFKKHIYLLTNYNYGKWNGEAKLCGATALQIAKVSLLLSIII